MNINVERPSDTKSINLNELNIQNDDISIQRSFRPDSPPSNNIAPNLVERDSPVQGNNIKLVPTEGLNLITNPKRTTEENISIKDDDDMGLDNIDNLDKIDIDLNNNMEPIQENNYGYKSDDDNNINLNANSNNVQYQEEKSYEELLKEKHQILIELDKLEKKGLQPSRKYTMSSNLEEMKYEYEQLKKQRETEQSVKSYRKILMFVVNGVEFLNKRFDPLDIKLNGWSESVYDNIGDYDEVFEELHEKYNSKVKMAPEIRLVMMVGGSAFMFHLTNSLFKSSNGVGDILNNNPDILKQFASAMNSMPNQQQSMPQPMPPQNNAPPMDTNFLSSMMNGLGGMMGGGMMPEPPAQTGRREMRGPKNVDDILNSININQAELDNISTASESDFSSVNITNNMKKARRKKNSSSKRSIDI